MHNLKLDELIKIPKKGDASKDKKQEFLNEMLNLLAEEGYSSNAEKYLMEGFSFCAVSPIIEFIRVKSSEERTAFIKKMIKSTKFKNNDKGIAFKILVSCLCQIINNYPEEKLIIEILIRELPNMSKTKSGKINGDVVKVIEKYFVTQINQNAKLPNFKEFTMNPIIILNFCKLFYNAFDMIKVSNSIPTKIIENLKAWTFATFDPPQKGENTQEKIENEKDVVVKFDKEKVSTKPYKSKELIDFAESLVDIESRLVATAQYIKSIEKGMNTLNLKLTNSDEEIILLKREVASQLDSNKNKDIKIEQYAIENSKINNDYALLKSECDTNKDEIHKLLAEIDKQNAVLSVFSSDKKSSQQEQLNKIASKLKAEYIDFKDALEIEMTIDLGENLRHQLSTIFKILSKNGIDIEGR